MNACRIEHILGLIAFLIPSAPAQAEMRLQTTANRVVEGTFNSPKTYDDPFNEIELDVVVTSAAGTSQKVPAFWAGGQTWRFRYAGSEPGLYHFRTECSDPANSSLQGAQGTIEIGAYRGANPFYQHGFVRVAGDHTHFEHADGTPFHWFADTWWMGLCQRLHWPEDFKTLAADRVAKGFNVVQIVAGLYPDMPAFDERGANEAGFPWARDYSRIQPEYFDAADRRIAWLGDSGIAPCIVGGWGYHIPWLGVERMKKHWRYLVGRYGAYPVFWCLAGEGVMPYYLSKTKAEEGQFQKRSLTTLAAYVRQIDPYHHAVSIHPSDMARNQLDDPSLIDFDMLQTGHGDRGSIPGTIKLVRASRAARPTMPTINAEVCYEGILGTCFADVERFMVWSCLLSGAAGHTYGANGIWQVNEPGKPYGNSPGGNSWGSTPWPEAAQLPGSFQTGLARKFFDRYDWWRFEPHPEWAAFEPSVSLLPRCNWIWFPEGNPARDAPAAKRYFRRSFELPKGHPIAKATLQIAVDDRFKAFLNGQPIGSHSGWRPAQEYNVSSLMRPGKNVLAVLAENLKAAVPLNPAGLICGLAAQIQGGGAVEVLSDSNWRSSEKEEAGWTSGGFDDQAWSAALPIAKYGEEPWGDLGIADSFTVPYAAGIPGRVRVIYIPMNEPTKLSNLEAGISYHTKFFNPQDGKWFEASSLEGDGNGAASVPERPAGSPDWVLVLEAEGR